MSLDAKSAIAFAAGFGGGWAARSFADSPHGVGVKLLEVGLQTRKRLERWAATGRERLEDMLAEAQSRVELNDNGPAHADDPHDA